MKNGVYISLVKDVRDAFEGSPLVKIDCKGMHASDYKKIGAKLKESVPCVLLSFDDEQILTWRGHGWKSMYQGAPSFLIPVVADVASGLEGSGIPKSNHHRLDTKAVSASPKMMSLWKSAIESSKALLLDEIGLGPDALLKVVEEFEGISQATEHSYPALVMSSEDGTGGTKAEDEGYNSEDYSEDEMYNDDDDDEYLVNESLEEMESPVPLGSLPVDLLAKQLGEE